MQSQQYQLSEIIFGEAMSDNSWNKQDVEVNEMGQLVNFQFNTENTYILQRYQINYQGINKANQVIRSAPYVDYGQMVRAKKRYVKFWTGQIVESPFLFYLVKTYWRDVS